MTRGIGNYGGGSGFVDLPTREDMEAFDALPRQLQRLLREASFNISAVTVVRVLEQGGSEEARCAIRRTDARLRAEAPMVARR